MYWMHVYVGNFFICIQVYFGCCCYWKEWKRVWEKWWMWKKTEFSIRLLFWEFLLFLTRVLSTMKSNTVPLINFQSMKFDDFFSYSLIVLFDFFFNWPQQWLANCCSVLVWFLVCIVSVCLCMCVSHKCLNK